MCTYLNRLFIVLETEATSELSSESTSEYITEYDIQAKYENYGPLTTIIRPFINILTYHSFIAPWDWYSTVEGTTKHKVCKPRKKKAKCKKSKFGCCPDKRTPAAGPFDEGGCKLE